SSRSSGIERKGEGILRYDCEIIDPDSVSSGAAFTLKDDFFENTFNACLSNFAVAGKGRDGIKRNVIAQRGPGIGSEQLVRNRITADNIGHTNPFQRTSRAAILTVGSGGGGFTKA